MRRIAHGFAQARFAFSIPAEILNRQSRLAKRIGNCDPQKPAAARGRERVEAPRVYTQRMLWVKPLAAKRVFTLAFLKSPLTGNYTLQE